LVRPEIERKPLKSTEGTILTKESQFVICEENNAFKLHLRESEQESQIKTNFLYLDFKNYSVFKLKSI